MVKIGSLVNDLLSLSDPEVGDGISNLKLQKLLNYCQGFHLAITNKLLFEDSIEAFRIMAPLFRMFITNISPIVQKISLCLKSQTFPPYEEK